MERKNPPYLMLDSTVVPDLLRPFILKFSPPSTPVLTLPDKDTQQGGDNFFYVSDHILQKSNPHSRHSKTAEKLRNVCSFKQLITAQPLLTPDDDTEV